MAKISATYTVVMSLEEVLRHNMLEDRDTASDLAIDDDCNYVCPVCGRYVADASGKFEDATRAQIEMQRFCNGCGQRLSCRAIDTRDCIPFEEME